MCFPTAPNLETWGSAWKQAEGSPSRTPRAPEYIAPFPQRVISLDSWLKSFVFDGRSIRLFLGLPASDTAPHPSDHSDQQHYPPHQSGHLHGVLLSAGDQDR